MSFTAKKKQQKISPTTLVLECRCIFHVLWHILFQHIYILYVQVLQGFLLNKNDQSKFKTNKIKQAKKFNMRSPYNTKKTKCKNIVLVIKILWSLLRLYPKGTCLPFHCGIL